MFMVTSGKKYRLKSNYAYQAESTKECLTSRHSMQKFLTWANTAALSDS